MAACVAQLYIYWPVPATVVTCLNNPLHVVVTGSARAQMRDGAVYQTSVPTVWLPSVREHSRWT